MKNRIILNGFLLLSFVLLTILNLIFLDYQFSKLICIYGFISFVYILYFHLVNLLKKQIDLSINIFLFGSLFWFWKEIISLSFNTILFENLSGFSPYLSQQIPIDILAISLAMFSVFNFFVYFLWFRFRNLKFPTNIFLIKSISKNSLITEITLMLAAASGWIPFSRQFGGFQESFYRLLLFRTEKIELDESLLNYLPIVAIMASSYAFFRLLNKQSKNIYITTITIILGGLIAFLSGTRFKIVFLILPALLSILIVSKKIVDFKNKVLAISFVFSILIAVSVYQVNNRYGTNIVVDDEISLTKSYDGSDHFTALTHAVAISDELDSYFYQPMIFLFTSDFIPRMFWPNKPKSKFWEFYNDKIAIAGNVTPSILGQYFLNWGFFGVFIAAFNFAFWLSLSDFLLKRYKLKNNIQYLWLTTVTLTFLFLSFRVYSFNYFFYLLIAYFFCWYFTKSKTT